MASAYSWLGTLKDALSFLIRRNPVQAQDPVEVWLKSDALGLKMALEDAEGDPIQLDQLRGIGLDALDRLFRVEITESDKASPYPRLHALQRVLDSAHAKHQTHLKAPIRLSKRKRERDEALNELSDLSRAIKRPFYDSSLDSGVRNNTSPNGAGFDTRRRKQSLALYRGLHDYWACNCNSCEGFSLSLGLPQSAEPPNTGCCFDVFFATRSRPAMTWKEGRISIVDRKVNFKDEGSPSEDEDDSEPISTIICASIRESLRHRSRLCLRLEHGCFKRLRPDPNSFDESRTPPYVSLASLFEHQKQLRHAQDVITLRGRRILAVVIARALMPFLETPWLHPNFTLSQIHFFKPLIDGDIPDITKPYLAIKGIPWCTSTKSAKSSSIDKSLELTHGIHPHPSIFALAVLLCELHYCLPIHQVPIAKDLFGEKEVNIDYYAMLSILDEMKDDVSSNYYFAIQKCLNYEYLPPGKSAKFDSTSVQENFYEHVVKRLEEEIMDFNGHRQSALGTMTREENEGCWGRIGTDVIRQQEVAHGATTSINTSSNITTTTTLKTSKMVVGRIVPGTEAAPSQQLGPRGRLFDAEIPVSGYDLQKSQDWLDHVETCLRSHVNAYDLSSNEGSLEHIKIAILDTGYDPDCALLYDENGFEARIKDARCFVSGTRPDDVVDEVGHGTHALGLLLKAAPCAEVYIARVSRLSTIVGDSCKDIAEALEYAVTKWKVNVIAMSFGLRDYDDNLERAISTVSEKALLFAAASNDGGNRPRAFPAKHQTVFCIHATDGEGNRSKFSPTPEDDDLNFSLLGEAVSSHWPIGVGGHRQAVKVLSGTSVATPIAAGVAASLLSFVRQYETASTPRRASLLPRLKKFRYMRAVLKQTMVRKKREDYDYLTPDWLFADLSKEEMSADDIYSKIRSVVKDSDR